MRTTDTGVPATALGDTVADAADAFLTRFNIPEDADPENKRASEDEAKTAEKKAPEAPKDEDEPSDQEKPGPEGEESEGETEESEEEAEKAPKKTVVEDDEAVFKVKIGDEEREVPAKDLKRLYGQEAALTRKSQEVAETRKKADADQARAAAALDSLLKRAQEKAAQFSDPDLFVKAAKNLSEDEFNALRAEASRAFEEVKFLQTGLDSFTQEIQQRQASSRAEVAKQTIKDLNDPASPNYIEGWNQKVYDGIREFAIGLGVNKDLVNNVIEAPILKLMHMAMQFQKGAKTVEVQKVKKTPTKIVKNPTSSAASRAVQSDAAQKALKKLRASGSMDDTVNAFLARMQVAED